MKFSDLPSLRRHLGTRWLAGRALYAIKLRSGLLRRRLPARKWEDETFVASLTDLTLADVERYLDYRRTSAPAFFFAASQRHSFAPLFKNWDDSASNPVSLADSLGRGVMRYFEHTDAKTGFPPDWHRNPFSGEQAPHATHWSQIGDFGYGDIKVIWEPSRFGFAFTLVRAYWRTGDERYPELFWQLVESWREQNQPQQGPNWKCGQEASFRAMAWCFGLHGFLNAQATNPKRVARLAQMLALSAYRIESNINYALSQSNNHGISEGAGIWTIGVLFPEFRQAGKWRELGRKVLEKEGRKLIYDDGAFAQHSMNYHRLMLHDYIWSLRLGELNGLRFSTDLMTRVGRAGEFLFQVQDDSSGRLPCYGQNDGALILPLNSCEYSDYRAVIAATQFLTRGTRQFAHGPWDEDLLWLFGKDSLGVARRPHSREDLRAEVGGYYTIRTSNGFVFTRCARFRHRPAQADMLHVDLWWRGQNIALDAGTFSYNAPAPWERALSQTEHHNTVSVDGLNQMEAAGRFLWLPWLAARVISNKRSSARSLHYWEGEHDGYRRLANPVRHRRAIIRMGDENWLVVDRLNSSSHHDYRLHWLLADVPYDWNHGEPHLTLRTDCGMFYVNCATTGGLGEATLIRADEKSPRGWASPYYGGREPALSLALTGRGSDFGFLSYFGPQPAGFQVTPEQLRVETDEWEAKILLSTSEMLAKSISITGGIRDRLDLF